MYEVYMVTVSKQLIVKVQKSSNISSDRKKIGALDFENQ